MPNHTLESARPKNADFLYSMGQKRKAKMIVLKSTQEKVLAVLQSVSGIVERRHTLPCLANRSNTISNGFPESGGGDSPVDGDCDATGGDTVAAVSDDDSGDSDGEPARRQTAPHKKHPSPPALLAFESVSHYVSFGRSRIYQLIAQGEFPAPVKIGKSSRWVRAEIDTWISHQSQQRTEA